MSKETLRFIKYRLTLFYKGIRFHLRFMMFKRRFRANIRDNAETPQNFRNKLVKHNDGVYDRTIPRHIWLYWNNQPPKIVEMCIEKIRILNPDFNVTLLNDDILHNYVIDKRLFSNSLTSQLRSDLIRLYLLKNYGGIWVDASIMVFENFEWVLEISANENIGMVCFYRDGNTCYKDFPVVESWFIAASKDNPFVSLWLDEMYKVLDVGVKQYITETKAHPSAKLYLQNIGNPEYLVVYIACQRIIRNANTEFVCFECDKSCFLYQLQKDWCRVNLIESLSLKYAPESLPLLIKLTREDRQMVNNAISHNRVKPNSLLDLFISL